MKKYIQFVQEFHENNALGLSFIENQLKKHLETNQENQTEIETVLDFLYSNQKTDISKIGYKTILEKTEKWHKKLQAVSSKDNEKEGVDYEIVLDFKDGFKFVKLISKPCYEREGKMMSHCVASYFGRKTTIYSLRDSKNNPHCTIEDGQQVKGKGNGKIDPKYIDYVVKFLELKGMTVGENEMKNLGYIKLEKIDKGLTCDSLYNGYVNTDKLNTVKDNEGRTYKGMGLFTVKEVCDIDDDGKFRLFEDIKGVVAYEKLTCAKTESGHYTQNASSGHSTRNASSGHSTQNASSGHSTQNASSGDSTQNASSGHSTQNASSGHYTQNASSGDYTRNASSGHSTRNASSGHYTKNASSGHYTRSEINGKYGITADIGIGSKSKGVIGTWIVLAEYKKNSAGYMQPITVKCGQIDGKILKENTWYTLNGGEFTETEGFDLKKE